MKRTVMQLVAVFLVSLVAGSALAAPFEDLNLNVWRIDGIQVMSTAAEINTLAGGTGAVAAATVTASGALTGVSAMSDSTNPIATAVSVDTDYGQVRKTVVTMTAAPIIMTTENPTTNTMGGTKILDFPEGVICVHSVVVNDLTMATNAAGAFSTNLVSYSLGSTAAAKPGLLTTAVNFAPTNDLTQVTNYYDSVLATDFILDGSAAAVDLYLNATCESLPITNTASGTATILWSFGGDN